MPYFSNVYKRVRLQLAVVNSLRRDEPYQVSSLVPASDPTQYQ